MTMSHGMVPSQNLRASTTPQQTMTQFDVFANPVTRSQASYPFVVMLQADVARGRRERAVAPVAPRAAFPVVAGRLTPIMAIDRAVLKRRLGRHSRRTFAMSPRR